jgi:hypothetical protein
MEGRKRWHRLINRAIFHTLNQRVGSKKMSLREELKKFIVGGEAFQHTQCVAHQFPPYLKDGTEEQIDTYVEVVCLFDEFLDTSGLRKICSGCHNCCPPSCAGYSVSPLLCKNPTCLLYLCGLEGTEWYPSILELLLTREQRSRLQAVLNILDALLPRSLAQHGMWMSPSKAMREPIGKELRLLSGCISSRIAGYKMLLGKS